MRTLKRTTPLCVFFLFLTSYIGAQCADQTGFARKLCEAKNGANPSASSTINSLGQVSKSTALTTSYNDSIHGTLLPPATSPAPYKPLLEQKRADDGSFVLEEGAYETTVEGYLLDLGAQPTKPGAFFPAPFKGARSQIVQAALKQAELHPELSQGDLQGLISAVVANADIEVMSGPLQQAAVTLLTHDQLKQLQGASTEHAAQNALGGILRGQLHKYGIDKQIDQTQAKIESTAGYQNAAGVMANVAVQPVSILPTARGSWVLMPGDFYVRYLPEGNSKVLLQVMVAPGKHATFDPTAYVLVLGATPSMRLGITVRGAR
jgi:hypothetical protein